MKVIGIIAIIIVIVIVTILVILSANGLFKNPEIKTKRMGPYLLVYQKHIGDYKKVAPKMDQIFYDLKDKHNIETTRGFGIYYDDPKKTETENLRSIVGCTVENRSIRQLQKLGIEYQIDRLPPSNAVVAEFPYKGKMSIMIGMMKAYPALSEFIQKNNIMAGPMMEIYDQPNKKIEYIAFPELPNRVLENLFLQ